MKYRLLIYLEDGLGYTLILNFIAASCSNMQPKAAGFLILNSCMIKQVSSLPFDAFSQACSRSFICLISLKVIASLKDAYSRRLAQKALLFQFARGRASSPSSQLRCSNNSSLPALKQLKLASLRHRVQRINIITFLHHL